MRAKTIDGTCLQTGDPLTVDSNYPVTFVRPDAPDCGDDETGEFFPGQIVVRWSWGAEEAIDATRAGVFVEGVAW